MLSDIDDLVHASMAEWKVPDLSLAVIRRDETLVLEDYGVRDSDAALSVSADTRFLL